jgi:hypothetical protein
MSKKIARTSLGLRDALFDELDSLRSGESNPQRASAMSKLAVQIINSVKMEVDYQKHVASNAGQSMTESATIRLGTK